MSGDAAVLAWEERCIIVIGGRWRWMREGFLNHFQRCFCFFQAEDGIRDYKVTGVQTCALPISAEVGGYTVGVLVQCNYGLRQHLRVAGVPVGEEIPDLAACTASSDPSVQPDLPRCGGKSASRGNDAEKGSIIAVVATDAPLLPHQLKRVVTRVAIGLGRMGGFGGNSSGDIFVAFSTANAGASGEEGTVGGDAAQCPHEPIVLCDRAGDRGGDSQRNAGRGDDDGRGRHPRVRLARGPTAGRDGEVWAPAEDEIAGATGASGRTAAWCRASA